MSTEEETPTQETEPTREQLAEQVEKWKSLSRKNEARAKENAAKAVKFDEIQEARKTEQEELQNQLSQAAALVQKQEAQLARLEAAQKYSLSDLDMEILELVSAEKVEETAERLAAKAAENQADTQDQQRRNLAQRFGTGTPVPAPDENKKIGVNDLIRAART